MVKFLIDIYNDLNQGYKNHPIPFMILIPILLGCLYQITLAVLRWLLTTSNLYFSYLSHAFSNSIGNVVSSYYVMPESMINFQNLVYFTTFLAFGLFIFFYIDNPSRAKQPINKIVFFLNKKLNNITIIFYSLGIVILGMFIIFSLCITQLSQSCILTINKKIYSYSELINDNEVIITYQKKMALVETFNDCIEIENELDSLIKKNQAPVDSNSEKH